MSLRATKGTTGTTRTEGPRQFPLGSPGFHTFPGGAEPPDSPLLLSAHFLSGLADHLGGVAAAFLTGEPTTLGCLLGLLAVFAIAVRNGIAMVRHYRSLEKREGGFSPELVARGTSERVGPVLTTALVTAAMFLPMLFMGGIAGLEILHPLAITVLGGLVSSTAVTLFVVPGLYLADGAEVEPDVLVEEEPPRLVA